MAQVKVHNTVLWQHVVSLSVYDMDIISADPTLGKSVNPSVLNLQREVQVLHQLQ